MQEIKFRAWDNVRNKMHYVGESNEIAFGFDSAGIVAWDLTEKEDRFKELCHLKYMQYTGLEDKNGNEIYEGDIILLVHETGLNTWDRSREVVEFDMGAFSCSIYSDPLNRCDCEVIGNIYENTNLIK